MGDEEIVEQSPEHTDEQLDEVEQKYLSGDLVEGEEPKKKEPEIEDSEESDSTEEEEPPKEEGPAVQENKRLRQRNRELGDEMQSLKAQVNELSQKMTQKDEPKKGEDRLATASVDELLDAKDQLDEALYEAKQQEDQERVTKIRSAKRKIEQELLTRPTKQAKEHETVNKARSQWQSLESSVIEAMPEIKQTDSKVYKAAVQYATDNPELMQSLGEAGALVAIAASIITMNKGTKQGKSATRNLVKEVEQIVESSTGRTRSTTAPKGSSSIDIRTMKDDDMDDLWDKIKMGERSIGEIG